MFCSDVDWTRSVIACPVNVDAKIMEELHHRCVAVLSCDASRDLIGEMCFWLFKIRPHLVQQPARAQTIRCDF